MSYSFIDFAVEVLKQSNKPLSKMEIWNKGVELGLDRKLGSKGRTPWQSIGARIYSEIKYENNSRFKQVGKRPTLFALVGQEFSQMELASRQEEADLEDEETGKYNERDLHSVLVKYLITNPNFKCYTKTIFHENSKKKSKNADQWTYPDLIGVYFPFEDFDNLTLRTIDIFNERSYKVFSFEMKKVLNLSNIRACYFQALSNSSWANEGYLVAPEISEDEEFLSELSLLNKAFGIGVIKLNLEFPEQSEILFYSKQKESLDINMLDKLIDRNKDVRNLFISLIDSYKLSKVNDLTTYDKVLNDDEYQAYLKQHNMLSNLS